MLAESFKAYVDGQQLEKDSRSVKQDLDELDKKLKNPIFDEYARLEKKDRVLQEQISFIKRTKSEITRALSQYDSGPEPPKTPDELSKDPAVKRMQDVSMKVRQHTSAAFTDLVEEIGKMGDQAEDEYLKWKPQIDEGREKYEDAVHNSGGDYKKLAQRRALRMKDFREITSRLSQFKSKSDRVADLVKQRNAKLKSLREAYLEYTEERKNKCKIIEDQSTNRLKVAIHEGTDVEELKN
ncbi:MAG: hypothetical protein WBO10_06565, partial [Pyrinomonadaceae bacterium]